MCVCVCVCTTMLGHHSKNALEDAVLSFPLLHINGVMVFDDYLGGEDPYSAHITQPKAGIDAFLMMYAGRYKYLRPLSDYQLVIQKLSE